MVWQQKSKPLGHYDNSGYEFSKEMLAGDPTAAINFDRIQQHPIEGYIIFEYLLCNNYDPYKSDPKTYWEKGWRKFIHLYKIAFDLNAKLYLITYAKKGTEYEDHIKLVEVESVSKMGGIKERRRVLTNRLKYQEWFRQKNMECMAEGVI